jgi:uncharacterized protein YbjQ (UPF0145 family)
MLLSSLESMPGHTILRQLDVVYGSTVRSKHVGRDLMAGLKNIVGGELTGYTELLEESRQEATQRMIDKARSLGANAVVGIRFSTSNIAQGASELFVYGTAVVVQPITQNFLIHLTLRHVYEWINFSGYSFLDSIFSRLGIWSSYRTKTFT